MMPQVITIQPCAIVDHLCIIRDEAELKQLVADEVGAATPPLPGMLGGGCCQSSLLVVKASLGRAAQAAG